MTIDTHKEMDKPKRSMSQPRQSKNERTKAIVAKSDFDCVVQTIDNHWEAERRKLREARKSSDDQQMMGVDEKGVNVEEKTVGSDSEDSRDVFLSECQTSLKDRLYKTVEPISDEDYHQRSRGTVIEEQMLDEDEEEQYLIAKEEAADRARKAALQQTEGLKATNLNIDYDDHELMDQDALKRARDLREKVRNLATETRRQQDIVLQRAIQLTKREICLLTEDILAEQMEPLPQTRNDEMSETNTARFFLLQQMEASLKDLTNSLSDKVDGALPENLRDLRDTIQNIQKSLQKKDQPLSQLSQTEQAIVTRDNEGDKRHRSVGEDEREGPALVELDAFDDMTNPEFILADFLSKY